MYLKHVEIVEKLVSEADANSNIIGLLLFGSVAAGTHRENSDIDIISILQSNKPGFGIENRRIDGIKVGNLFLTFDILTHSVETVPYLLYTLDNARLLFDRNERIYPLREEIKKYFVDHPETVREWNVYFEQFVKEKAIYGYEKTTIIEVWNNLEKHYSGGKIRRHFFNSVYMTNPLIFALLKKLLQLGYIRFDKPTNRHGA
jgi:predicted nucleotidyltransferase